MTLYRTAYVRCLDCKHAEHLEAGETCERGDKPAKVGGHPRLCRAFRPTEQAIKAAPLPRPMPRRAQPQYPGNVRCTDCAHGLPGRRCLRHRKQPIYGAWWRSCKAFTPVTLRNFRSR